MREVHFTLSFLAFLVHLCHRALLNIFVEGWGSDNA